MSHLAETLLWDLASGETPEAEAASHLGGCGACRTRLAGMTAARSLAARARLPDPAPGARAVALQRFEAALQEEQQRSRRWLDRRPMIGPALGLAALAGAAVALLAEPAVRP